MPQSPDGPAEVTLLLQKWAEGDRDAFDRASAIVYPELRRIAQGYLSGERTDHTLAPTALIHEAFLRFTKMGSLRIDGRRQFYALAARLMRQILVDYARSVKAKKRGGGWRETTTIERVFGNPFGLVDEFLLVHGLIDDLRTLNPRKADLIELRYFGGFTLEESAAHLGISRASAHREQRLAEAWLNQRISSAKTASNETV